MLQRSFSRWAPYRPRRNPGALLACDTRTCPAGEPTCGGTLVFGINCGDPPAYDCHQSTLFPIIHLLTPHYSNLLRIDHSNYPNAAGDLAESWTVSEDLKTYSFRLR
jgi:ABC-type transport system substrate-binding protein